MRKIITYALLTTLLLTGVYLVFRFAFGFFTPFNAWTAQQDIKGKKIKIVELGELPLNYKERKAFAKTYGIDIYYSGCSVTTDISNGTKYYNETIVDYLEKKYGNGWWIKFQAQLDSVESIEVKAN